MIRKKSLRVPFLLVPTVLVAALLTAVTTLAADPGELFRRGNEAYQSGNWPEALEAYRQVLNAGYESGPLYYNIGNCHYKLKEIGQAILYYEKARRLIPDDEDLEFNLSLAKLQTVDRITPLPRFWLVENLENLLWAVPRGTLWWGAFLFYFAAAAAFVLRILAKASSLRSRGTVAGIGLAALALSCAALLLARDRLAERPEAVVLAESTRAFSGPGGDNVQVFVLHEGTKVRIDKMTGGWAEVVLADGNVGWIREDDMAEISSTRVPLDRVGGGAN